MVHDVIARLKHRDEHGATIIIMVIVLVVMLALSALIIDIGAARASRRQIQNGADAAALGAAQELPDATGTESEAKDIADDNINGPALVWAGCTDSAALAHQSSTPCISFDTSFTMVRVRVPTQTYGTTFARAIGISSVRTQAAAVARVRGLGNGGLLPFTLFTGFGNGEACMDAGGNGGGGTGPCSAFPITGNFGGLDFSQYGNALFGTSPSCGTGQQAARYRENIAMGADHFYSTHPTGVGAGIDDDCVHAGPNRVAQVTGNGNAFDEGLISGSSFPDGRPARLKRVPTGFSGWQTVRVSGEVIDNRPLWEFIPSGTISGIPASCQRSVFDNLLAVTPTPQQNAVLHGALATCINDYVTSGSTTPVFTLNSVDEDPVDILDIQLSPRFVYVPQVWETAPCPGNSSGYCYHIRSFRAAFLQRIMANNPGQLDVEPGPWNPSGNIGGNHQVQAVTAFVLPPKMLPGNLGSMPVEIGENARVELVK